jgi:glucose uptake protein
MIFPSSDLASFLVLVFSMICWGSWANTQKLVRPRRFELYYYDFIFGFLAAAVLAAFTFGSLNTSELSFQENFLITAYRNMAWAVAAGMVFGIGNIFLLATVSISGLAVAFPVALGTAVVVGTAWNLVTGAQNSAMLAILGVLLVLIAVVIVAFAYGNHLDRLLAARTNTALRPDPRLQRPPKSPSAAQAVILGVISGFAFGFVRPLTDLARETDNGVAPYGLALLLGAGMLAMAVLLTPFFFNFPVAGEPLGLRHLFSGSGMQHFYGFIGGVLAGAAVLGAFVVAAAPATARVTPGITYALMQGGTLLAALWGLLVWREFKSADLRVRTMFAVLLIVFALGIGMLSVAQS